MKTFFFILDHISTPCINEQDHFYTSLFISIHVDIQYIDNILHKNYKSTYDFI